MQLYEVLGWLSVVLYVLLSIKYLLKPINRKLRYKPLGKLIGYLTKYHKYLGILFIVCIVIHAYVLGYLFTFHSGTIILVLVILTSILGYMQSKMKNKNVLKIHRLLSVVILCMIIYHIYF